jgi:molybdopterin-guanine dinucleotide biosynthesis protein A
MRLIALIPDQRQVGSLIDTLRNNGFDRKDMIVSNLTDDALGKSKNAADDIAFIKSEREGFGETESFAAGIEAFQGKRGIVVAVETPKSDANKVRGIMEQSGATEIIED